MMEFLKVVEKGEKSQRKYNHLSLALQKVHSELQTMDDDEEKVKTKTSKRDQFREEKKMWYL